MKLNHTGIQRYVPALQFEAEDWRQNTSCRDILLLRNAFTLAVHQVVSHFCLCSKIVMMLCVIIVIQYADRMLHMLVVGSTIQAISGSVINMSFSSKMHT
jgi:hypothetical protein